MLFRYQSCWPAIQHEVQGIIFVHTDNLPEEVSSLRTLYHHFVEETNFPESRCLVVKNQTGNGDDLIIEKNPLPNLNHVVANCHIKGQEFKNNFIRFLSTLIYTDLNE